MTDRVSAAARAAFQAALCRACGWECDPDVAANALAIGWTADLVDAVAQLCRWAARLRLPVASPRTKRSDQYRPEDPGLDAERETFFVVYDTVEPAAHAVLKAGGTPADALAWASVQAAAPHGSLLRASEFLTAPEDDGVYPVAAWLPFGRPGALAWAAGVSLQEVREQATAGPLDLTGLSTLAALRGWHLNDCPGLPRLPAVRVAERAGPRTMS